MTIHFVTLNCYRVMVDLFPAACKLFFVQFDAAIIIKDHLFGNRDAGLTPFH